MSTEIRLPETGVEVIPKYTLAPLTSWKVGGPAEYCAFPVSIEQVLELVRWGRERGLPIHTIGGGTNALISDQGIRGLVICTRNLIDHQTRDENGRFVIEALAGINKSDLMRIFKRRNLAPALFLSGLPGDLGGGIAMNAGVGEAIEPREFVEVTDWVDVVQWRDEGVVLQRYSHSDLSWTYRHCTGWRPGVIVRAQLSWPLLEDPDIHTKVNAARKMRLEKQPLGDATCGSTFKNPPGDKAGRLIESCGLKGYRKGSVQVSDLHANFIVNTGGATAAQVHEMIQYVQNVVKTQTGVELQTEVVYMGEWKV